MSNEAGRLNIAIHIYLFITELSRHIFLKEYFLIDAFRIEEDYLYLFDLLSIKVPSSSFPHDSMTPHIRVTYIHLPEVTGKVQIKQCLFQTKPLKHISTYIYPQRPKMSMELLLRIRQQLEEQLEEGWRLSSNLLLNSFSSTFDSPQNTHTPVHLH